MPEENIENITNLDSKFATFIDRHGFHGHSLIKNNISIPKKVIFFTH